MDSRKQPSPSSSNQDQFAKEINQLLQIINSIKQNPSARVSDEDVEKIKDSLNYLAAFNCGVDIMNAGQKDEYYCIYNQQSQSPIFFYGHHFKKPHLDYVQEMPSGLPLQNIYGRSSVLEKSELDFLAKNLQHMLTLRELGVTRFIKAAFPKQMEKENCEAGFFAQTTVADPKKAMQQAAEAVSRNRDQYRFLPITQSAIASSVEPFESDARKTQKVEIVDKNGATYGAICKKGDEIIWGNIGDGVIGFEFEKDGEARTVMLLHEDCQERLGYFEARDFSNPNNIKLGVEKVKFCHFNISALESELSEESVLAGYKLKKIFIASQSICDDNLHLKSYGKIKNGATSSLHKTIVDDALIYRDGEEGIELSSGFNRDQTWLSPKKDSLAFVIDVNDKDFIASVVTGRGARGADVAKIITQELQHQVGQQVEEEVMVDTKSKQSPQSLGALAQAAAAVCNKMQQQEKSPMPARRLTPLLETPPLSPASSSNRKQVTLPVLPQIAKIAEGSPPLTKSSSSSEHISIGGAGSPVISNAVQSSKARALRIAHMADLGITDV